MTAITWEQWKVAYDTGYLAGHHHGADDHA